MGTLRCGRGVEEEGRVASLVPGRLGGGGELLLFLTILNIFISAFLLFYLAQVPVVFPWVEMIIERW